MTTFLKNKFSAQILISLFIAGVAFALFYNSLHGQFVYNDHFLVQNNYLTLKGSLKDFFNPLFHSGSGHYLPMRYLSYNLDFRIWGMNPFGFHLTNVLLHSANAVLMFFLVMAFFCGENNNKNSLLAATAAAILFATHPLMCEPVAWISGRKELLSCFFTLIASLLYLKSYKSSTDNKKTDFRLLASLLCYIFAVLSNSTAIAFPLVLVATEFLISPGEGRNATAKRLERLIPFFIVFAIIAALDISMASRASVFMQPYGGSAQTHLFTVAKIPLLYLEKLLWPSTLSPEYSFFSETSPFSLLFLSSLAFLVLYIVLFIYLSKKNKSAAWFMAWTAFNMAPIMNFIPTTSLIADRHAYLPSIGIFGLVALAADAAARNISKKDGPNPLQYAIWALLIIIVAAAGTRTVQRNRDWQTDLSLWNSALEVNPHSTVIHYNLGSAYFMMKNYEASKEHFEESININPYNASSLLSLGTIQYQIFGEKEEGMRLLEKAVQLQPRSVKGWSMLAAGYFEENNFQKAADAILNAIRSDPQNRSLYQYYMTIVNTAKSKGVALDLPDFSAPPDKKYKLPE